MLRLIGNDSTRHAACLHNICHMPSVLSGHTVDFGSSIGIYWGMQIDSFEILVYPTVMSNNLIISHKQEESDEQEHEATVEPC